MHIIVWLIVSLYEIHILFSFLCLKKVCTSLQFSKLLSGFQKTEKNTLIVSQPSYISCVRCNVDPICGKLCVHVKKLCTSGKVLICSGVLDRLALRELQGNSYESISVCYRKMKTMCFVLYFNKAET